MRKKEYRLTLASPRSVLLFVNLDIIWAAEAGATCFVTSLYKGAIPWPASVVTYTVQWSVDWAFVNIFKCCSILSHVSPYSDAHSWYSCLLFLSSIFHWGDDVREVHVVYTKVLGLESDFYYRKVKHGPTKQSCNGYRWVISHEVVPTACFSRQL